MKVVCSKGAAVCISSLDPGYGTGINRDHKILHLQKENRN